MSEYYVMTEQMVVGYGDVPLLEQVEIKLHRGEIMTLIGPNGVGKSTVLKNMAGQMAPLAGTVYLEQADIRSISRQELAKKLSIVMTERIHPELLTCMDVVSMGRYPYTGRFGVLTDEDREKVYEAMRLVDILDLQSQDFMVISDGQRQRVMLARAICQEPEIMILDEPTSYLDIRYKLELLSILKHLAHDKNMAILMSLHEIDLAQKISDKIICVKNGQIDRVGMPEEILCSAYIEELYDMKKGSYNAMFGCMEMETVQGTPKVFVIGGGGKGIPVYHRLQKKGIPFAAGVLHQNDVEYQTAKALAVAVVEEKAFCPISEQRYEEALEYISSCEKVIACVSEFGEMNEKNRNLLEYAQAHRKLCDIQDV